MKITVVFLLLAIVASTPSSAASSVNPTLDKELSTNGKVRFARSTEGFNVDDMPKAKLSRGTFADEKSNVNGVKRGGGNLMAIILRFLKDLLANFNVNFD